MSSTTYVSGLALAAVFFGAGCASEPVTDESSALTGAALSDTVAGKQVLYCRDGSSAQAEAIFGETEEGYSVTLTEAAFKGQTLGMLLTSDIAPEFLAQSTGRKLGLFVTFPKTQGGSPACRFSAAASDVVSCTSATLAPKPSISDGISSAVIGDSEFTFSTEHRTTKDANGSRDELVISVTLFGAAHPFPTGYHVEFAFDRRGCQML
jgi:hypothetical protein